MFKIARLLSVIVLVITFLCGFSFIIRLSVEGSRLGEASSIVSDFSNLPRTIYYALKEVKSPERFVKINPDLKPINELDFDVPILGSEFKSGRWEVYLKNLRDNRVQKKWTLEESSFHYTDRVFSHSDPRTPILLEDSSIVINSDESFNLYRISSNSEIVWENHEHQYHHSINLASDGNIWTCTRTLNKNLNKQGDAIEYYENFITKIDSESGKTISNLSISEIFRNNNLTYFIHGFNNLSIAGGTDPFHLNDVEEAFSTTKNWNKGDLFISLRNRSMILHYRPSTDSLIKYIQGPFVNQHDIDILNDSTLRLFNNNVSSLQTESRISNSKESSLGNLNVHAEIVDFNYNSGEFSRPFNSSMEEENVYTLTQGLQETLMNGAVLVESQNAGLVYVFKDGKTLFRNYIHEINNGLVEPPHWVRLVE